MPNPSLRRHLFAALLALPLFAGCSSMSGGSASTGHDHKLTLSGALEVPPVTTAASGTGTLTVRPDGSVSGSFTTSGAAITAAHIHSGAPGQNGPVLIPLTRSGENSWVVPANAKLTDDQMKLYRAGNLYVNFHTKQNPGGEIRAQIKP